MKLVCGIGVNDCKIKSEFLKNGGTVKLRSYVIWRIMLLRCYSTKFHEIQPTYELCTVSKDWLLYSNFKKWYDSNFPIELSKNIKFELDKDLLFEGNKIYSEKNCIFLPQKINKFMSNKYSNNKTGCTGVSFKKNNNKFASRINDFYTGKEKYMGLFQSVEEANLAYTKERIKMSDSAKEYMRELKIYSEEVINKIK